MLFGDYTLGVCIYHNFCPYEDAEFDFSVPGVTVIEGRIDGILGCDSNGSGKSYLLDGPAWALFDRCLRASVTGEAVRRRVWNEKLRRNDIPKGTWTSVEQQIIGPKEIRVIRYRGHPTHKNNVYVYVDGANVSRGTNPQTNLMIVELLGMDFQSFCNSVAFGAREDVKSFFSADDATRKKITDSIFGLEIYPLAQQAAKTRQKKVQSDMADAEHRCTHYSSVIESEEKTLAETLADYDPVDGEFRLQIRKATAVRLSRAITRSEVQEERLRADLSREQEGYQRRIAIFDKARRAYEDAQSELTTRRNKVKAEASGLRGRSSTVESQRSRIHALKGDRCPTCTKALTVAEANEIVAQMSLEVDNYDAKAKALDEEAVACQEQLTDLEPPAPPPVVEIPLIEAEIREEVDRRKTLEHRLELERVRIADAEEFLVAAKDRIARCREKISDAKKDGQCARAEWKQLEQENDRLEFWVQGFGNQGLKSFLVESEIPQVNKAATAYAQKLLGPGAYVRMSATTTLKSKSAVRDKISIDGVIPGLTNDYTSASKGQKRRMDLALIMAFGDIIATRAGSSFSNFFADELFDGVDATGCETVVELLKELAESRPVTLVSHTSAIKQAADRVVIVHHDGERATLEVL